MADKWDALLLKMQTDPGGLSKNEQHDAKQLCKEHSPRGQKARDARDGK